MIPLLIALIAFVGFLGFQTSQVLRERSELTTLHDNQNGPVEESAKARQQLDVIAKKTAELAAKGNTNAQAIVAELAKQGVKIDPTK
jgi:hypothetical protein